MSDIENIILLGGNKDKFPVITPNGEMYYVPCKTIVYGDDEFDELIESINNNPDLWR